MSTVSKSTTPRLLAAYLQQLNAHPLRTKMITGGTWIPAISRELSAQAHFRLVSRAALIPPGDPRWTLSWSTHTSHHQNQPHYRPCIVPSRR